MWETNERHGTWHTNTAITTTHHLLLTVTNGNNNNNTTTAMMMMMMGRATQEGDDSVILENAFLSIDRIFLYFYHFGFDFIGLHSGN